MRNTWPLYNDQKGTVMIYAIILAVAMVLLLGATPADAACKFKFQCSSWNRDNPRSVPIYQTRDFTRARVGSVYDPGHGKPLQVLTRRDFTSEIVLEIDKNTGTITRPRDFSSETLGRIGD